MSLGLLMLLEVCFLSEEYSARCALERPDAFVDALVHIAVRGRREDLKDLAHIYEYIVHYRFSKCHLRVLAN